ncbi:MAG: hypothetical protein GQ565_07425 [Candidatus Aegiribacteria sp.]|nr:hypothetical protein [Candidatus Aegiribacteria sp.]
MFLGNRVLILVLICLFAVMSGAAEASEDQASASTATISGHITGYPSDWFPPMYVYARNVDTKSTFAIYTCGSFDCATAIPYTITVCEPGTYTVFAWTDRKFSGVWIGGFYSCYNDKGSIEPIFVEVELGQEVGNVNIESNMFNIDQDMVPLP